MPTLVNIIDTICEWVDVNVCQKVELKEPPEDIEEPDGAEYEYKLVKPKTFPIFIPSQDKLPPKIRVPFPSVCVRIIKGTDGINDGSVNIELDFCVWNPGTHGMDILNPVEGKSSTYTRWTGKDAEAYYKRDIEGWRDIWNWLDLTLRELESTTNINGLSIDRTKGIEFEPLKDENGIVDYYPFWFVAIRFTVNRHLSRNVKQFEGLL